MKKILFFAAVFLLSFVALAQPPIFEWAKSMGSTGDDSGIDLIVDASGNVYSAGGFNGTVDFDPGPGVFNLSAINQDAYITKHDKNGNFIWAQQLGGPQDECIIALAFDTQGNLLLSGWFMSGTDFDPGSGTYTLSCVGLTDPFVCKLTTSGAFVWTKKLATTTSTAMATAYSMECDAAGDIYIVGDYVGTVDFDPGAATYSLTSVGARDAFICKLNSTGALQWMRRITGSDSESAISIGFGKNSEVYVAGVFSGTADLDPGPATFTVSTPNTNNDIYIIRLTTTGNFVWGETMGGSGDDGVSELAVDYNGDIFLTGGFEGVADLDPTANVFSSTSAGLSDGYLIKIQSSGAFLWARQISGTDIEYGFCVDVDTLGNAYMGGYFVGTTDFNPFAGSYTLSSITASAQAYIMKYNSAGTFKWAAGFGGNEHDLVSAVALDPSANVYSTGYYQSTADFDPSSSVYTLTAMGQIESFVHKLSSCVIPAPPLNITPSFQLGICDNSSTSLYASGSGTISWYNTLTGGVPLAAGASYTTPTLNVGSYSYYAEVMTCTMSASRAVFNVTVDPVVKASTTRSVICKGESSTVQASGSANFSWNNGDAGTMISVSPTITTTFIATGNNNSLFCANSASVTVTVLACVGLEEQSGGLSFELYPNPSSGILNVSSNSSINEMFEIFDHQGSLVLRSNVDNGKARIDVKQFSAGIYFLRSGSSVKKWIKE